MRGSEFVNYHLEKLNVRQQTIDKCSMDDLIPHGRIFTERELPGPSLAATFLRVLADRPREAILHCIFEKLGTTAIMELGLAALAECVSAKQVGDVPGGGAKFTKMTQALRDACIAFAWIAHSQENGAVFVRQDHDAPTNTMVIAPLGHEKETLLLALRQYLALRSSALVLDSSQRSHKRRRR